jgi:hypothetical protein
MHAEKGDIDIGCNNCFGNSAKKIGELTTFKIPEGFPEEKKQEEEYTTKCIKIVIKT